MASDIKKCQARGKIITLSLGGATADVGFSSEGQAVSFAKTIWNMFLGTSVIILLERCRSDYLRRGRYVVLSSIFALHNVLADYSSLLKTGQ